jgi:hypothetical protein
MGLEHYMTKGYARFECRICGCVVYSSIALEQSADLPAENLVELTCSSGHTDQYDVVQTKLAQRKPEAVVNSNMAKAAFA